MSARAVMYDSVASMEADFNFVKNHFQGNSFMMAGIHGRNKLNIFESLPPANNATFIQGVPSQNQTENQIESVILYAPNLQNIGSLDNTASPANSTYSKTVTKGFTSTSSFSFNTQFNAEANVVFGKVGITVGLDLTFTDQYSKTTSETTSFTVPGGKMLFHYQGYLNSAILVLMRRPGLISIKIRPGS